MAGYVESLAVANYSPATYSSRAQELLEFARWCEERSLFRPAEVTRPILERYQRHLYYYRKANGHPLSPANQGSRVSALRLYFRWLCRQGLLLSNPASDLLLPRVGTSLPRYTLSPVEVEKVLAVPDVANVKGLRDRALLELLWATGMRRAEASKLLLHDVRAEGGAVFISKGKGNKDRVVPVSARALGWVKQYVEGARPRLVVPPDSGVLFLSDAGFPLSPIALTTVARKYVLASGVEAKGACHLFRHACATAMLEGGADIRFVQELLGHSSLETTQVYTRVTISKLKAVYEATHPGAHAALLEALEGEVHEEEAPAR
jgi:integrase/recombinase XerD